MPCTSAAVALSTGWCPWVILYHGCGQERGEENIEREDKGEGRRAEGNGGDIIMFNQDTPMFITCLHSHPCSFLGCPPTNLIHLLS